MKPVRAESQPRAFMHGHALFLDCITGKRLFVSGKKAVYSE